jgi:hypothetical protein
MERNPPAKHIGVSSKTHNIVVVLQMSAIHSLAHACVFVERTVAWGTCFETRPIFLFVFSLFLFSKVRCNLPGNLLLQTL